MEEEEEEEEEEENTMRPTFTGDRAACCKRYIPRKENIALPATIDVLTDGRRIGGGGNRDEV